MAGDMADWVAHWAEYARCSCRPPTARVGLWLLGESLYCLDTGQSTGGRPLGFFPLLLIPVVPNSDDSSFFA